MQVKPCLLINTSCLFIAVHSSPTARVPALEATTNFERDVPLKQFATQVASSTPAVNTFPFPQSPFFFSPCHAINVTKSGLQYIISKVCNRQS